MKETKLTVEKQEKKEVDSKPSIDQKRIDKAKKEFEKFGESISKKNYTVKGDNILDNTIKYLEKVEWNSKEAKGLKDAIEVLRKRKKEKPNKEILLGREYVQLISYFVGKASGVGSDSAVNYYDNLYTPWNNAMTSVTSDNTTLEYLQADWQAATMGVDVDSFLHKKFEEQMSAQYSK